MTTYSCTGYAVTSWGATHDGDRQLRKWRVRGDDAVGATFAVPYSVDVPELLQIAELVLNVEREARAR